MKLSHSILPLLATLLGLMACACSDEDVALQPLSAQSDIEILPQAKLSGSRAALSGAQDGPDFPIATDRVFAVSAFLTSRDDTSKVNLNGENLPLDIPYFLNQPIKSDSVTVGKFHFYIENGLRYYPEDKSHVYFYAFSPACAVQDARNPHIVSWTLTGQEDIMYAKDLTGIQKVKGDHLATQMQPVFKFEHLLTRFNINENWGVGFPDNIKVTGLTVHNVIDKVSLDIFTGEMTYSDTKKDIQFPIDSKISTTGIPSRICSFLCANKGDLSELNFSITAGGLQYYIPLSANQFSSGTTVFENGKQYDINLTFTGTQIIVTATASKWEEGGNSSGNTIS